jgi:transcriptional regulator with GAF, ATPase, and Fis domain
MEGSLYVTEWDIGWMLLKDENSDQLVLRAQSNLPPAIASKMHHPWEDGVSSLVMLSGESLRIHGEGLAQFKLARLGRAALITPIKVRTQPIGVVCVARHAEKPFSERDQAMLEAVSDYASISLVNARLFQALETRAQRLQQLVDEVDSRIHVRPEWLDGMKKSLRSARGELSALMADTAELKSASAMRAVREELEEVLRQLAELEGVGPPRRPTPPGMGQPV